MYEFIGKVWENVPSLELYVIVNVKLLLKLYNQNNIKALNQFLKY